MAGHSVNVGEPGSEHYLEFRSKSDAFAFFRAMLGRYHNGQTISDPDSSHLRNLLDRHPEALQKIGIGVKRFFRARAVQGTDCFWLERDDAASTDFSIKSCVDAKGKSLYQEFAEACREAVQPELTRKKKVHFEMHGDSDGTVVCEVTGERVALYQSHLDHKKPMTFQVIVHTFITAHNIEIRPEMLCRPGDAEFAVTFADKDIEARFRDYHLRAAKLRIIKAKVNLQLGGSEKMIPQKRPVIL
jgi:hypothetical protein